MRPLELAQSYSFPSGTGVEFDQAQQFLGLGSGRAVGQDGDHRQDVGERFDGPASVGVGERGAGDLATTEVIMGIGVGVPTGRERAQRRGAGQLGVDQRHQMLPAAKRFVVRVGAPTRPDRLEPPPIERLDELAENGRSKAHVPQPFLCLDNQKIPRNLDQIPWFCGACAATYGIRSNTFPGHPCTKWGRCRAKPDGWGAESRNASSKARSRGRASVPAVSA